MHIQTTFARTSLGFRLVVNCFAECGAEYCAVHGRPRHVSSTIVVLAPQDQRASLLRLLRHLAAGEGRIWVLLAEPLCVGGNGRVRLVAQPPPLLAPRALRQGRHLVRKGPEDSGRMSGSFCVPTWLCRTRRYSCTCSSPAPTALWLAALAAAAARRRRHPPLLVPQQAPALQATHPIPLQCMRDASLSLPSEAADSSRMSRQAFTLFH